MELPRVCSRPSGLGPVFACAIWFAAACDANGEDEAEVDAAITLPSDAEAVRDSGAPTADSAVPAEGGTQTDARVDDANVGPALPDGSCGEPGVQMRLFELEVEVGCTDVRGSLHVSDEASADLALLNPIRSVGGTLSFFRNDALTDMHNLRSLVQVGGDLAIRNHQRLETLAGLEQLQTIGGELVIHANPALRSLANLSGLRSIGKGVRIVPSDVPAYPEAERQALVDRFGEATSVNSTPP